MSQHDFNIANQGFPATRADLNNALAALASTSSGDTEPSTTYANQLWYDTSNNLLKFRNEADSAWITFAYLDQASNEWEIRSAVIQAVDSAGVVIKTDDGTTRLTVADDGSVTIGGDLDVSGNVSVDGGTIKLDGNYPVGTNNVALGDAALDAVTSGARLTAIGWNALTSATSGNYSVAVGSNTLSLATTAQHNTAVGDYALTSVTGSSNTGIGSAALYGTTSGQFNVALGHSALQSNTTAYNNTAVGYQAGYSNTTGPQLFVGSGAGFSTTTGESNTAVGAYRPLYSNTTGAYNVAIGREALQANTTASQNTAVGYQAGYSNTTGSDGTYVGTQAGYYVTTGVQNTAVGTASLGRNSATSATTGNYNSAFGQYSLTALQSGSSNTGLGYRALQSNTTASNNTAVGLNAGYSGTTASENVFIGTNAGYSITTGVNNTFVGGANPAAAYGAGGAITTGSKNTIIGRYDGNQHGLDIRTSSNNIVLSDGDGNPRVHIDSAGTNYVWSTSAPMVWGRNNTSGSVTGLAYYNTAANIGSFTGQVFRVMCDGDVENANNSYGAISDIKLKENIVDANSQWDDLKALQVRNYNFKAETGYSTHTQLGLVAQEVELISPNLVGQSIDDETNEITKTVNYSILYMKAVKALQEAMDRIETLEAKVTALEGN